MIALKSPLRQTAGKEINFPSLVESLAAQASNGNRNCLEILGSALLLWPIPPLTKSQEVGNNLTDTSGSSPQTRESFSADGVWGLRTKTTIMKKLSSGRMAQQRRAKRLTQLDLARMVGCSESQISKIETGRSVPDKALKTAIADLLGIPSGEVGQ